MVGEEGITPATSCRNIGVVFDGTVTFETSKFCLQDFILELEEDLEDTYIPSLLDFNFHR